MTTALRTISALIAIAVLATGCFRSTAPGAAPANDDVGMAPGTAGSAGAGPDAQSMPDGQPMPGDRIAPDVVTTKPMMTKPATAQPATAQPATAKPVVGPPPPCEDEVVVTAVDVGVDSTCAVSEGGQLYCWGRNTATDEKIETPTRVSGIAGAVTSIALGGYHGCALTDQGLVWCWGVNDRGQLGNGTLDRSDAPTPVSRLTDVEQIAAGFSHTCAIRQGGQVWCWGDNESGQLGAAPAVVREPIAVWTNVNHALQVTAGYTHTCIRDNGHRVHCVGGNGFGQLGNGTNQSSAQFVGLDVRATDLSAGLEHTCAVDEGGDVWCWGNNQSGQLGDGTDGGPIGDGMPFGRTSPVRVLDLHGVSKVRASHDHTCALSLAGVVQCWGSNQFTALGYGTQADVGDFQLSPVTASFIDGSVSDLAAGSHTCVIMGDHELRCWGANGFGAVGDGTLENRFAPFTVTSFACE